MFFLFVSVLEFHWELRMLVYRYCAQHRAQCGVPRYRLIYHVPMATRSSAIKSVNTARNVTLA